MLTITYHRVTKYTQRSFTRKEHNTLIAHGSTWITYVALQMETSSILQYHLQPLVSQSNHSMSCIPSCCTKNGRLWSNLIELDAYLESLTVGIKFHEIACIWFGRVIHLLVHLQLPKQVSCFLIVDV